MKLDYEPRREKRPSEVRSWLIVFAVAFPIGAGLAWLAALSQRPAPPVLIIPPARSK